METSSTARVVGLDSVGAYYQLVLKTYASGGIDLVLRQHGLVLSTVALAAVVLVLFLVLLFMPSRRRVVVRRHVRVARQAVEAEPLASVAPVSHEEDAVAPTTERASWTRLVAPALGALVVVAAFVATYIVTGTDGYCGRTCHITDQRVNVAIQHPHARCVDCHEGGPLAAAETRLRMGVVYALSGKTNPSALPVDPSRCLGCHKEIARTVKSDAGLRVAHNEILASGLTCADCHADIGHGGGDSLVATMDRCTVCHDGKIASEECQTCHAEGSPLARPRTLATATARFTYVPVQVANRDCTRCHGLDKRCMNCHNGLLMPHPEEFRQGGHGRLAAFEAKERCYKCHALSWCSSKCHHDFSAHDEKKWRAGHQGGTSKECGSCHIAWDGKGNWCDVCH